MAGRRASNSRSYQTGIPIRLATLLPSHSADGMCLSMYSLDGMPFLLQSDRQYGIQVTAFLLSGNWSERQTYPEPRMVVFRLGAVDGVLQDVLLLQLDGILIHLLQHALG
ncbi:hypothetical protein RRF57_010801 [Xylaria bambusicola]|uniref:Uncharacterized protein n=1 Tax=Xylaria bambusicola TaxID=326684 RepID=A0AAN7V3Z0_9PEZI